MAIKEWISEDSADYKKILMFNDSENPVMKTAPGEKIDCLVYEAYAYVTKADKVIIGLVPKVQFATNMVDHPLLAGEYPINNIVSVYQTDGHPYKYLVDHRQEVSLDVLNHIIDLNKPDVLDPQTILDNEMNFKAVASVWFKHNWISEAQNQSIQNLPDGRCDAIDDRIVQQVSSHAGFKRALSQWREANWVSENKARQYALTGSPLKTIDDELAFAIEIRNS